MKGRQVRRAVVPPEPRAGQAGSIPSMALNQVGLCPHGAAAVRALRVKTRREVRMVLAIVVAWYANISEMPGMVAARDTTLLGELRPPLLALALPASRAEGTIQSMGSASLLPYRRAPCRTKVNSDDGGGYRQRPPCRSCAPELHDPGGALCLGGTVCRLPRRCGCQAC